MLSFEQISNSPTVDQWAEQIKTRLSGSGFDTSNWSAASFPMMCIQMASTVASSLSDRISSLANQTLFSKASGDGLTIKAESDKQLVRIPAIPSVGIMRFSADAGLGPYSFTAGTVTVQVEDVTFTNVASFTIPLGDGVAYQTASMVCNDPGTDGNVPSDSTCTLLTQNVFATVTNPQRDDTTSLLTPDWLVSLGVDEESDEALRSRCLLKDVAIARGENVIDKVKYDIVTALSGTVLSTGVAIDDQHPRGNGTFDVYIAFPESAADSDTCDEAYEAIKDNFAGIASGSSNGDSRILVQPAPTLDLNLFAKVYFEQAYDETQIESEVRAAVREYIMVQPIGGTNLGVDVLTTSKFFIDDLKELILDIPGVQQVTVLSFCGNGSTGLSELAPDFTKLVNGNSTLYPRLNLYRVNS